MAGTWATTDVRLSHASGPSHAGTPHPPGSHRPAAWAYEPVAQNHAYYGHAPSGGAGHGVPITETSGAPGGFVSSGAYPAHHAPYGHGAGAKDTGHGYAAGGGYGRSDYPYPPTSGVAAGLSSHLAHPHGGHASGGEYHPHPQPVVMGNGVWIPTEALLPHSSHAVRQQPHPHSHHRHVPRHAARGQAPQGARSHSHGGAGVGRERSSGGNGGSGGRKRRGQSQAPETATASAPAVAGWQEGVCVTKHGSSGGSAVKSKACRYWLHGVNNHFGRTCSFVHPCRHVVIAGKCPHGRRCTDDHVCRPHLWTDKCPLGGLEGGCPYIHLVMPEEREAVRAQYKGWCDALGRPTEDALLSLGITDPSHAPAAASPAGGPAPPARTPTAAAPQGRAPSHHTDGSEAHRGMPMPMSMPMSMSTSMPPLSASGFRPHAPLGATVDLPTAAGPVVLHGRFPAASGPMPLAQAPPPVSDSLMAASHHFPPTSGPQGYAQPATSRDGLSMPQAAHAATVSSLPVSPRASASVGAFAATDKPHLVDPRFGPRGLAPQAGGAAVPRPSSQTDHGSVWVHSHEGEGHGSRANTAPRASSLGMDSVKTITIRSDVAQPASQSSPRLDTAESETSVDAGGIGTGTDANGSSPDSDPTELSAGTDNPTSTAVPSVAGSSQDPSTGEVTMARASPRSSAHDILAGHRHPSQPPAHEQDPAAAAATAAAGTAPKPSPSAPASVHGSVCSGATSSVRAPYGRGMKHTSSGVSLSSSAGEEERPLDAEACSALCAAAGVPVGPQGRPLCPFWFADSLAGCRAGPDCPFFHHGQIQLTGRALPRRKDIEAAREAWARRVLDRGPQTGITTSPGQGIHRPGDTETPVAMANATKQAVALYESLGGDKAAAARAAALAERGDAASETASNGVSSRGGNGNGNGGASAGGDNHGNSSGNGGSTRRSRRRRSNASRGGGSGGGGGGGSSRGGGGPGDSGSPLRGQASRRPGSAAPPSPMLQGMGFGGPVHGASASLTASPRGAEGGRPSGMGMSRSPHTMGMGRALSGEELAAMGLPASAYTAGVMGAPQHADTFMSDSYHPSGLPRGADPYRMPGQQSPYTTPGQRGDQGALPGGDSGHRFQSGTAMAGSRGGLVTRQSHGELYTASSMLPADAHGSGPGGEERKTDYSQPRGGQHLQHHPSHLLHHPHHQNHPLRSHHSSASSSPLARVAGSRLPRSGSSGAVMMTTSERPQHQQRFHQGHASPAAPAVEHATGLVLTAGQLPAGPASSLANPATTAMAAEDSSPWSWPQPDSDHLAHTNAESSQPLGSKAQSTATMSAGVLTHGHGSATVLPVVMDTEMELQGAVGHASAPASWAAHSIDAPASRFLHQSGTASAGQSGPSSSSQLEQPTVGSLLGDEGVASKLGLTSVGSSLGLSSPSVHSGPRNAQSGEHPQLGSLGVHADTGFGVVGTPGDDLLGSPDTPGGLLDPTHGLHDPLSDMDAAAVPVSAGLGMLPFGDEPISSEGRRKASLDADDNGLVPFGLLD